MEEKISFLQEQTNNPLESLIKDEKVAGILKEFELKAPSPEKYQEALRIVENGLPLMRSIEPKELTDLLLTGKEEGRGNMGVVYASIVVNKGYGPIALQLSPELMQQNEFTAYAVDNSSTYVTRQMEAQTAEEEARIMQKYSLSPDQFRECYAFCIASVAEHPLTEYPNSIYEKKQRYINFDIGIPKYTIGDIEKIYYKATWEINGDELEALKLLAAGKDVPFETISSRQGSSLQDLYQDEIFIRKKVAKEVGIPSHLQEAVFEIA